MGASPGEGRKKNTAVTVSREAAIAGVVSRGLRLRVPRPQDALERVPAPVFWLGAHEPWWAWEGQSTGRLILSARRILRRRSGGRGQLQKATVPLFIDSGAFSEVSSRGTWAWASADFAAFIMQVSAELGTVQHVGIQDWMCEPQILATTGLTLEEHQRRTVANFLELRRLAPRVPWVPTLQGMTSADYMPDAEAEPWPYEQFEPFREDPRDERLDDAIEMLNSVL